MKDLKKYIFKFKEIVLCETTLFDENHLNHKIDKEFTRVKDTNHEYYQLLRKDLSEFFLYLPKNEKNAFKREISNTFKDRVYELVIHQIFSNQCYKIRLHNGNFKGNTKPDFELSKFKEKLYAEAKNVYDLKPIEKAVDTIEEELITKLNEIQNKYFFLRVKKLALKVKKQPSSKNLIRSIKKVINSYTEDQLSKIYDDEEFNYDYFPPISYEDENVIFRGAVHLRRKDRWDIKPSGFIGTRNYNTIYGDAKDSIRDALKRKATKYGKFESPFVICINVISKRGFHISEMVSILYGTSVAGYSQFSEKEISYREKNGFYTRPNANHTRVSGVLATCIKTEGFYNNNEYCYFPNPNALYPYKNTKFNTCYMIDELEYRIEKGEKINKLLRIKYGT